MPIIGNVGRRSLRVRALNISIHVVLCLGAVTMIYPFLIMISSSIKSRVDSAVFDIVPRYMYDDEMLFRKYVESRYNEGSGAMNSAYEGRFHSFRDVVLPDPDAAPAAKDWLEFLQSPDAPQSVFDFYVAEQTANGVNPRGARAFRDMIKRECNGSIAQLNDRYDMSVGSWEEVKVGEGGIATRNFTGRYEGILSRYREYKLALPPWQRAYVNLDGEFIEAELRPAYAGDLKALNTALGTRYTSWNSIVLPRTLPQGKLGEHWARYVKKHLNLHFVHVRPEGRATYLAYLKRKYESIDLLNRTYGTSYGDFDAVQMPAETAGGGAPVVDLDHFLQNLASPDILVLSGTTFAYRDWLRRKYGTPQALDRAYGTGFASFAEVDLRESFPSENEQERADWFVFATQVAAPQALRLHQSAAQRAFLDYVTERFPGSDQNSLSLDKLNAAYGTSFQGTLDVYPAATLPQNVLYRRDWLEFVSAHAKPRFLQIQADAESANWQAFLTRRYGSVAELNRAWGITHDTFDAVNLPLWQTDAHWFQQHKSEIFWEFIKRNYLMVLDVMLYNGHAILNTVIYCFLAIATALTVNPLAAYAMSRYKLPATYKIILILMLTMAFPPMVMGIPSFLLLKKLDLLNTFAALILPGVADGYFIFLLKGFFDSLPKELFESATIDGASERQIFWNVAMALSKPIMAVIALGAFNAAYRNFMMAFIVCQDDSMWTLMVHIYQLMQRASASVGFAALVIAAIPTFMVFIFCQNIIIRGIVIPTEK